MAVNSGGTSGPGQRPASVNRSDDGRQPERLYRPTTLSKETRFDIPRSQWPRGMCYEWKTFRMTGNEERAHIGIQMAYHWRFVPPDRHPELEIFRNVSNSSAIEIDGLVLMERAQYLVDEARLEHRGLTNYRTHNFIAGIKAASAEQIGVGQGRTQFVKEVVRGGPTPGAQSEGVLGAPIV